MARFGQEVFIRNAASHKSSWEGFVCIICDIYERAGVTWYEVMRTDGKRELFKATEFVEM